MLPIHTHRDGIPFLPKEEEGCPEQGHNEKQYRNEYYIIAVFAIYTIHSSASSF